MLYAAASGGRGVMTAILKVWRHNHFRNPTLSVSVAIRDQLLVEKFLVIGSAQMKAGLKPSKRPCTVPRHRKWTNDSMNQLLWCVVAGTTNRSWPGPHHVGRAEKLLWERVKLLLTSRQRSSFAVSAFPLLNILFVNSTVFYRLRINIDVDLFTLRDVVL